MKCFLTGLGALRRKIGSSIGPYTKYGPIDEPIFHSQITFARSKS